MMNSIRRLNRGLAVAATLGALVGSHALSIAQPQRVLGADISYWDCSHSSEITQSNWNYACSPDGGNRVFVQLRATRGGTNGVDQTAGDQAPGGGLVLFPADGKVMEFDHAPEDFAPLPQSSFAQLIQLREKLARVLVQFQSGSANQPYEATARYTLRRIARMRATSSSRLKGTSIIKILQLLRSRWMCSRRRNTATPLGVLYARMPSNAPVP